MSSYRIQILPGAHGVPLKLDKPIRRRIQTAIDRLAGDPRPHGTMAPKGQNATYRLRVGDGRVLYDVHDGELVVLVIDLGHRRDLYRDP